MNRQPQSCPVCSRQAIQPLLENFRITAEGNGNLHDVKALGAFMCKVEGHIFFVRLSDLEQFEAAGSNT